MTHDGTPPRPPQPAPSGTALLQAHLEHFRRRVLQDALAEGTSAYWLWRATRFDLVGTEACDLIALNCRRHAALIAEIGLDDETTALIDQIAGTLFHQAAS